MSRNCTIVEPHLKDLLTDLGPTGLGLVISTGVATLFVLVISILTMKRIHNNTTHSYERFLFYCLAAICPVVGVTAFVGIISPRSLHTGDLLAGIYLSLNVVVFFRLLMLYHGGEKALCENMKGIKIPFAHPPFCCCQCLRNVYVSRSTLKRVKTAVYQVVVVRPILLYMGAVVKAEDTIGSASLADNPVKADVSILTTISTLTALWALMALFHLSMHPLKPHGILPKFLHLKLVMLFCDPQAMIINLIVTAGALPCGGLFFHPSRGEALKCVFLCFEMALLSVVGFIQYGKPQKGPHWTQRSGIATVSKDDTDKSVANWNSAFSGSSKV